MEGAKIEKNRGEGEGGETQIERKRVKKKDISGLRTAWTIAKLVLAVCGNLLWMQAVRERDERINKYICVCVCMYVYAM